MDKTQLTINKTQLQLVIGGLAVGLLLAFAIMVAFLIGSATGHKGKIEGEVQLPSAGAPTTVPPVARGQGQGNNRGQGQANNRGAQPQVPGQAQPAARGNPAPAPPTDRLTETPQLELRRAAEDNGNTDMQSGVTLSADFECALAPKPEKLSDTHFVLHFPNDENHSWMFRLKGVSGKTIRIDLTNMPLEKWYTLNPVYQYAGGVSPISMPLLPDNMSLRSVRIVDGHNGTHMPDTSGQRDGWHFIPDVWLVNGRTMAFVATFDQDDVTISMETPFTLGDESLLCTSLPKTPDVEVLELGMTPGGRPIHVIRVGAAQVGRKAPCVVMYAREHGDETDSSWLIAGAARRLSEEDSVARNLRGRATFLFIPILDPDAVARLQHQNIIMSFLPETPTPESKVYANFFRSWVAAGNRLDMVFDLHNLESAEGGHMTWVVPEDQETKTLARSLHDALRSDLIARGFNMDPNPWQLGSFPLRLGTWLGDNYGSILLPYELNSQERGRHLSAYELEAMGGAIAAKTVNFFDSPQGKSLLSKLDEARKAYTARWNTYGVQIQDTDALTAEQKCLYKARSAEILRRFESGEIGSDGKPVKR